jgi:hypothetical protein
MKPLLLLPLLLLTSCSINISIDHDRSFHHVVVVWLKDHGNAAQRKQLLEVGAALRRIPGVQAISMGTCVTSPRPIVDSTYDVAFDMTFPNQATMKQYLAHPDHVKAASENLKPLAKKIVVYDFQAE